MKRKAWTIGFLTITMAALGMEFYAGLDNSPNTVPWTELISSYIPQPITVSVLVLLATWLPVHFRHSYTNTSPKGAAMGKYRKFIIAVVSAAAVALTTALSDNVISKPEWIVIGVAVLGAVGVYAAPNKTTEPGTAGLDPVPADPIPPSQR